MKSFASYFSDLESAEGSNMRLMKIIAEQPDDDLVLWNTENDRWSRKAKHPLRLNEIPDSSVISWDKGDYAMYESCVVEIAKPKGPNKTIGIILEGQMKMVLSNKLSKIDEGVLGGMQSLNPLNRIMQLAGISVPSIAEPAVSEDISIDISKSDTILESDATNMFEQLMQANLNGEYRNNPDAARLATIGDVMVGLQSQIEPLEGKIAPDIQNKITAAVGLGAALLTAAKGMTQPQ